MSHLSKRERRELQEDLYDHQKRMMFDPTYQQQMMYQQQIYDQQQIHNQQTYQYYGQMANAHMRNYNANLAQQLCEQPGGFEQLVQYWTQALHGKGPDGYVLVLPKSQTVLVIRNIC